MSSCSIALERKPLLAALVVERRTLLACTALVGLSAFVWITAITTHHWFYVYVPSGGGLFVPETRRYFIESNSGLWQLCRRVAIKIDDSQKSTSVPLVGSTPIAPMPTTTLAPPLRINSTTVAKYTLINCCLNALKVDQRFNNMTDLVKCKYLSTVQTADNSAKPDPVLDASIVNYSRTEVSFAVISLMVIFMGFGFSIYTFLNPRYTFKRLASGIHFITAATTLVVIQVLINSVEYERVNVSFIYPTGAQHSYGYSFFLACSVLMTNLVAAAAFLWYSRKRKGAKAATDELAMADEPTIIGR